MTYFKDPNHFLRSLNKALQECEEKIDPRDLLPKAWYIEEIYDAGLADTFGWQVRTDGPQLLKEDNVLAWLTAQKTQFVRECSFRQLLTAEFETLVLDIANIAGIYGFWRPDDLPLYIGKSVSLGKRMLSSFERFRSYDRSVLVKYIVAKARADIGILETYFIAQLKPPYNSESMYHDMPTISVSPIPDWSEPILCNTVEIQESS